MGGGLLAAALLLWPAGAAPVAERPPQYVVVSFDGGASAELWQHWRDVGHDTGARFTVFLSGVYLLTPDRGTIYHAPHRKPGRSSIGFLPVLEDSTPEETIRRLLDQIDGGLADGDEIGTHFNGHFCSEKIGVGTWNGADWQNELGQWFGLLGDVNHNNELDPPAPLALDATDVVGARTPCLQGDPEVLYPVLAKRGFRYDASFPGLEGEWPRKRLGLWSYPVPAIKMARSRSPNPLLAYDYSFYDWQAGSKDAPVADEKKDETQALETLTDYFERSYYGRRAPVLVSGHFERWNHEAYLNAMTRFVEDVCVRPEVECVTYRELTDWLDSLTPEQLALDERGDFPKLERPAPQATRIARARPPRPLAR